MDWVLPVLQSIWDVGATIVSATTDALGWFGEQFGRLTGWLVGVILAVFGWLLDSVGALMRIWAKALVLGIGEALSLLPVPAFVTDLQGRWNAVPWSSVSYFLGPFEVAYGFTVTISARVLKFFLRVVPWVGVMWRSPSD